MRKYQNLENHAPRIETHRNVFAAPTFVRPPRDPQSQGSISGCLYREDRTLIALSQRNGGHHGDHFPSDDPLILPSQYQTGLPVLHGKSIYLGHYLPHFGHFLVEMLSTFWTFTSFDSFDHFVFHPFAFGNDRPSYIFDAFRAFNLPLEKLVLVEQAIILENVTIPERLVHFHSSANIHARTIYRQLLAFYSKDVALTRSDENRRYYISRVKTSIGNGLRTTANEFYIERELHRLGFSIIYPEELSFPDQISLFACAEIVCGIGGSGLHNSLFMRPNALLIEIGDARSSLEFEPMQAICNELAEIEAVFIPFHGRILNQQKLLCWLDVERVISDIKTTLGTREQLVASNALLPAGFFNRPNYIGVRGCWLIIKSLLRLAIWTIRRRLRRNHQ